VSAIAVQNPQVILLSGSQTEWSDSNVIKIVEFMGGSVRTVRPAAGGQAALEESIGSGACVIAQAKTFASAINADQLLQSVTRSAANCLIYGFDSVPEHARLISKLTCSSLKGVQSADSAEAQFSVAADGREIGRQFTGLTFGRTDPAHDSWFIEEASTQVYSTLIKVDQKPFFVRVQAGRCQMFLLACRTVADLDTPCSQPGIVPFFSRLAPLIMFLRHALQRGIWHNDNPRACFIIDDPLLKERHGFLNYQKLLELMGRERFSTSIAFIPWNYRRSQKCVAEMFAPRTSGYSLCVHGCDHTAGEFGAPDAVVLREKAERALRWMGRHREMSGLPFDNVMVFPGGVFSAEALNVLGPSGYLAAINSTAFPVASKGLTLRLRELLDVAVLRFSNFPLFVRRYPKDMAEVAFDLLLGRPALLVEHHDYFRDGYDAIVQVARTVSAVDVKLEWMGLAEICSTACLKKVEGNGEIQVRFYCDRFRLFNSDERAQRFVLWRRQGPAALPSGLTINGQPTRYEHLGEDLRLTLSLEPGATAEISIERQSQERPTLSLAPKPLKRAGVFARRHLCEFRDNYVHTNRLLNQMAGRARRVLAGPRKTA
jgi:hypothetical protein